MSLALTYNSVKLPYPLATEFGQDAVTDEGVGGRGGGGNAIKGTDWYCTRFSVKMQCLINSDYLSQLAPDLVGSTMSPAQIMEVVRSRLLVHRKRLFITFNGVDIIPQAQTGNAGTVDAQNGPQPKSCTITELAEGTFLMTYHIVAHYWENNKITVNADNTVGIENRAGNPVLFNRWTETVEIDDCNYSRRTRAGRYVIRSDNVDGKTADQIRNQMAVVSIPTGFLRKHAEYTISPDGLAIQYNIIDQEVYLPPPSPAYYAEGDYIETAARTGLGKRYGECWVRLRGAKTTNRVDLLKAAIAVVSAKLLIRGRQLQPSGWNVLESAVCRLRLYDNEVEFRARCMIAIDQKDKQGDEPKKKNPISANPINPGVKIPGLGAAIAFVGGLAAQFLPGGGGGGGAAGAPVNPIDIFNGMDVSTPYSTGVDRVPLYTTRGSANLLLQAAAYYDPSITTTIIGKGTLTGDNNIVLTDDQQLQLNRGLQPGQAGKNLEA